MQPNDSVLMSFSDPAAVARYAEGPLRFVPAFHDLQRMAALLLAERAGVAIGERLPTLSPEHDEALLHQAGFTDVSLFYAAFTFRGWVATA